MLNLNLSVYISIYVKKLAKTNQRLLKEGQAIQNTITPYCLKKTQNGSILKPEPLKASVADNRKSGKKREWKCPAMTVISTLICIR